MTRELPSTPSATGWIGFLGSVCAGPIAAGYLASMGFAPWGFTLGPILGIALVLHFIRKLPWKWAALSGLVFGTSAAVSVAPWVYTAMREHYHFGVLASAAFNVLIVGVGVGLYFGVPLVIWRGLVGRAGEKEPAWMRGRGRWLRPLLAAALVFLAEVLRTRGAWSMPWGLLGYGLTHTAVLAQAVDLFGVLGFCFATPLVSALLMESVDAFHSPRAENGSRRRVPTPALVGVGVLGVFALYGLVRGIQVAGALRRLEDESAPLRVALVQANIPQGLRWRAELVPTNMKAHLDLSKEALEGGDVDLVIWPETAMNTYITDPSDPYYRQILGLAFKYDAHFLVGGPHATFGDDGGVRYYNSVFQIEPRRGLTARYDKLQLLAFAEYNPLLNVPLLPRPKEVPKDYSSGAGPMTFEVKSARLGPMICFEALYPWLPRAEVARGADVLLNVSNDAWFQQTKASPQHVEQARIRAIELRRYLIRNAGTGISAIYDPLGRTTGKALGLFERGVVKGEVRPVTLTSLYALWGDRPLLLLSLGLVFFALVGFFRERRARAAG